MDRLDALLAPYLSDARHDDELWNFEYDCHPYLKNVTEAELDARYLALVSNLFYLLGPFRDGVPINADFLSSWYWLKKRCQTLREYERRSRQAPAAAEVVWPAPDSIFKPKHPNADDFIARYGDKSWLVPMLAEGHVRLSPAAAFNDAEMTKARADDELEKPVYSLGDGVRITMPDGTVAPIIGDLRRSRPAIANYFVVCFSNEFDRRLFDLFKDNAGKTADACLVVWEVDELARRLEDATKAVLPTWYFHHNPIQYFDPRQRAPNQIVDAGMSKDFAFAHQREYRFVWMPYGGGEAKTHLHVVIGPITDIAGLFDANGACLGGRERR